MCVVWSRLFSRVNVIIETPECFELPGKMGGRFVQRRRLSKYCGASLFVRIAIAIVDTLDNYAYEINRRCF